MIMLYGTLFMMAGAYTLSKNGHVRGDVLYGFFRPRTQATIDLTLYILFFLPGVIALTYAGWTYAVESWAHQRALERHRPTARRSTRSRSVIPIAGAILLLQGLVEIVRCVDLPPQGPWPSREEDVEEVDVDKLKEMVDGRGSGDARRGSPRTGAGRAMTIRKELWFGFSLMGLILAPSSSSCPGAASPTATSAC